MDQPASSLDNKAFNTNFHNLASKKKKKKKKPTMKNITSNLQSPYLSSWHISRFSLSRGVRRRTVAPSSSVFMSELSCRLQRAFLWLLLVEATVLPMEPRIESPWESALLTPVTELVPVVPPAPDPLEPAVWVPASAPSGLLSEG